MAIFITDKSTSYAEALGENTEELKLINKLIDYMQEAEGSIPEITWNDTAEEDYNFYAGSQDSETVLRALRDQNRPSTVFNEVKPKIDMLIGMADQVRREPTLLPVGFEDEPMAQILNGAFKHFRYLQKSGDKEMECFEHQVKSGRSFLHYFIDNSNPFEPEVKNTRVPGRDAFIDPNSIEYDLSDAKFIGIQKWYTEDELQQYIPKFNGALVTMLDQTDSKRPSFFDPANRLYRLVEMWYTLVEKAIWFINPITGKADNLNPKDYNKLAKALKEGMQLPNGETLQVDELAYQESFVKRKYFCLFSGPYIMSKGRSPYKHDYYPIVLYGAYKDEDKNTWFGAIKTMKDPQTMINTMRRQLGHLLQTAPKGLLMEEMGVIQNKEEYEINSSKPNFILQLIKGGLSRVKFTEQPQISPIYGQLDSLYTQSMKDVSGIQDTLMGIQQGTREPGVTARQRLESSVAVLYILFSNFRKSRIQGGKIQLAMIQQYMTQPYMIRLEGEEGAQLMQINTEMNPEREGFNDISAAKFDLIVDEEAENVTVRRGIAQMLMEMNQNNPGTVPPEMILEYFGLPFTIKQQVKQYNEARIEREMTLDIAKIKGKNNNSNKE